MNIQINPSDMPANQISLNDKIKQILSAKLTPSQIEAGYVCTKELTYILSCTEKTLSRWRQQRTEIKMSVSLVTKLWGNIGISWMTSSSILLII